jgi:hypothetical protein
MAACRASACAWEEVFATCGSEIGKIEEAQPPLRPDAPNPAYSFSTMAMRRLGSA